MKLAARNGGMVVAVVGLLGAALLWLVTGTHTEKSVVAAEKSESVRSLEAAAVAHPTEEKAIFKLAQAYLDAKAPGLAVTALESSFDAVHASARLEDVYARALYEQGRNGDALAAEERVIAMCAKRTCEPLVVARASIRAALLAELVRMGVEDAFIEPDLSALAYQNAVREARVGVK
jgi:hypothetical protein